MASTVARPLLSATEKTLLTALVETLSKAESQFCCGGCIELPPTQKLSLFYKLGLGEHARSIALPIKEPSAATIAKLLDACVPSPHGRGGETVYDESYRLARELPQGDFALSIDPVTQSLPAGGSLLHTVEALVYPRAWPTAPGRLVAAPHKLNAYAAGGFFKAHRDTPRSGRHVGSLVVALPAPFAGGALRVSHEGKDVLFDWAAAVSAGITSGNASLPWAFFFSDVEHEVLPVTSGTRITLAYEIYVSSQDPFDCADPAVVDGATLPSYSEFQAVLKNPDFLPDGGQLALALSHAYPIHRAERYPSFATYLKGSDAALKRVLSALRIPTELRLVYEPDDASECIDPASIPSDGFGPNTDGSGGVLYTTDNFTYFLRNEEYEEGEAELFQKELGACFEPAIIWGRKPHSNTFVDRGGYLWYGNEASWCTVYAAAALVLKIPPVGQGARA